MGSKKDVQKARREKRADRDLSTANCQIGSSGMAAVSTGFVGAMRFEFLAHERDRLEKDKFKEHLTAPQRRSPVLLDSEKPDEEQFRTELWPADPGQLVWLKQSVDHVEPRPVRPASRHKLLVLRSPARPQPEWLLGWQPEPLPPTDRCLPAADGNPLRLLSHPSTRCEDWSTLRQLLPSRGRPLAAAWDQPGGNPAPPVASGRPATSFPRMRSEMTSFCDAMFVNDKDFWNR
uniref:Ribosome biogenesis protein NOP53 n=1 Tax=Macrostomum lignano TaxID=282301 RepID=A0A1I8HLM1_9PLAT